MYRTETHNSGEAKIEIRTDCSMQVTYRHRKYWSYSSFSAGWHLLWYKRT